MALCCDSGDTPFLPFFFSTFTSLSPLALVLFSVLLLCFASLVPIPSIVDAAPADASSAAAASSEPCVVWLEELLARAVLKSRRLVLAHWASTAAAAAVTAAAAAATAAAAAAAAATANKDKAKAAIVSSSSDGSSDHNRVPLTLAAAISKLRHPLLAHPHRNVGNSGALRCCCTLLTHSCSYHCCPLPHILAHLLTDY